MPKAAFLSDFTYQAKIVMLSPSLFCPPFNPNIDRLQAVKVTKSGHHLSHDRANKGYAGADPGF